MATLENTVYFGDNLPVLKSLPYESIQLIYIDPPFNTGREQQRSKVSTKRSEVGNRIRFKGERYETVKSTVLSYDDQFANYWEFLEPSLGEPLM